MKLSIVYFSWIVAVVIGLSACASSQETQDEVDNLETQQQGNNTAQQGNSDAEPGEGENFEGQSDGELVNNAADEEIAQQNSGQEALGEQINNAALDTDQADQLANNVAANPTAGQSANEIPAAPTDGALAPAPTAPPAGGGIVKYAPANVEVFDQPNGKMIGQLEMGDHPLVYDENGWSRTYDGRYVNQTALSTKGIGRSRDPGIWK